MMKVLTIVGTRPEIIRLSESIKLMDKLFNHRLVHTGQNYDKNLNEIFFDDLGLRSPDIFLNIDAKTASQFIAAVIELIEPVLDDFQPDAVVILGDTNSSMAAITAKRKKIPIFHIEAGNRCFDINVPEEINRKVIDHISDINITYSEIAKTNLLSEGLSADKIFCIGSPMKEVLTRNHYKINSSTIVADLKLEPNNYFLVSMHREENVDNPEILSQILIELDEISDRMNKRIIMSTHPRTRRRLSENSYRSTNIEFLDPLSFTDYVKLQKNAYCVLSDSGTITEESFLLKFPAINLRSTNERQEGFIKGGIPMVNIKTGILNEAIKFVIDIDAHQSRECVEEYDIDDFSIRLAPIIVSYTNYVKQYSWGKVF
jgi:UDP-N-acetylglucosamine 2-epimerase (non-hydrolysing)